MIQPTEGQRMRQYFTGIFAGAIPPNLNRRDLDRDGIKCVGFAGGNAHAERCRMRKALEAIVARRYANRTTFSPETAWAAAQDLNREICDIFAIAAKSLESK
jgi:hypothetical protein